MAVLNNSFLKDGFRDVPWINAANTYPTPTAAPANLHYSPMVANPAPINLAAINIAVRSIDQSFLSVAMRIDRW
jgi:hypothetical protein